MNDTLQMVVQLINGVGFPIAACIAMGWFVVWNRKQNKEEHMKTSEEMTDMINKLSETVEKNTDAINALKDKLDKN